MRLSRLLLIALLAWPLATPADETELPLQALLRTLTEERAHPLVDWRGMEPHLAAAQRFYQARGWEPAWSANDEPTAAVREVLLELRAAGNKGLDADDYAGIRLTYLLIDLMTHGGAGPEDWGLWDVALTAAVSRYISDLHYGRIDPARLGLDLTVDHKRLDVATILAAVAGSGDPHMVLADTEPDFRTYEILKRALARYRELVFEPGLTSLPALPRRSLRIGDTWSGTAALRRLLIAVGDLSPGTPAAGDTYTAALAEGVKAFQYRHGLEADGAIGKGTLRALTTPLTARARQIELTLERWRWVPQRLDSPPIVVNIPQYKLFAFKDTTDDLNRMLVMDVVVGSAFKEQLTPVFAADMTYVVFRPYWDVPYNIAVREIIPDARSNPAGYLARHRYEIVNGYGDAAPQLPPTGDSLQAVAAGTARIRQKPGDRNSLGSVKFMLPNPHNVYLHDTPADHLFARARRDFSHGCVRLSDPAALARHVFRDDPAWTAERIDEAMAGDKAVTVKLARPIRVYFVYATAMASDERVFFFEDIYGHDATLDAALLRQARR
jgi:L,D-transpeptidase YcbB